MPKYYSSKCTKNAYVMTQKLRRRHNDGRTNNYHVRTHITYPDYVPITYPYYVPITRTHVRIHMTYTEANTYLIRTQKPLCAHIDMKPSTSLSPENFSINLGQKCYLILFRGTSQLYLRTFGILMLCLSG